MRVLCHTDSVAEGQSKGFEIDGQSVFVVHRHGQFFVYRNRCPHLGINLEWMPDQFLDNDGCLIQCAMHGALFLIDSGLCISGPCQGDQLEPVAFRIREGKIWL